MKAALVNVKANVEAVMQKVRLACAKSGRRPEEITIVAVSKSFGPDLIESAHESGISDFGENYLQECLPKQEALSRLCLRWHFIGHPQRNKAALFAEKFSLIHGVDSIRGAMALDEAAKKLNGKAAVLLQVKARPESAHGFFPLELLHAAPSLAALSNLSVRGLMVMAPPADDPEESRPYFRRVRESFHELKNNFTEEFRQLSMGMTDDYPAAVEEGATLLRIGRGIFGERARTAPEGG